MRRWMITGTVTQKTMRKIITPRSLLMPSFDASTRGKFGFQKQKPTINAIGSVKSQVADISVPAIFDVADRGFRQQVPLLPRQG